MDEVHIKDNLSFEAKPVRIKDRQIKQLRSKTISMVKVLWNARSADSTWELEEIVRESHPHLFASKSIFDDENFVVRDNCKARFKKKRKTESHDLYTLIFLFFYFLSPSTKLSLLFNFSSPYLIYFRI